MKGTNKSFLLLLFSSLILPPFEGVSQTQAEKERLVKGYIAAEQIISMSFATPFDRALIILNELSKKFLGKIIFDPEKRTIPIGVDIESTYWRDALERILRFNKLWYEETEDYIRVISLERGEGKPGEKFEKIGLDSREVQISAVFYALDAARIRESGINWSIFRGHNVNVRIEQNAAKSVNNDLFQITGDPSFGFDIDVHTLMRFFESKSLGDLISRPQITVRSGHEGMINIGTEFPVNTRDFAGNIITRIERAGTIIQVTPDVITDNGTTFIHLKIHVERSNVAASALGFEKATTNATTYALLLDGEETVIGGLYTNEEKELREGIPVLKDLPWWFLGLRYLFGHSKTEVVRKDLIILIKASLVPPLAERDVTKENLIEKQRRENEADTKFRTGDRREKK